MAGTELVLDVAVILGALIHVPDQETDGGSRGQTLKHTGQNFHFVRLSPLGRVFGLPCFPAFHPGLYVGSIQRNPWWHTINNAAQGGPVTLAKGREGETGAERVSGHARLSR